MYCAIDFGTSNSGIALPLDKAPAGAVRLLEIEPGHPTMPTAVFYGVEGLAPHEAPRRLYGRAAWRLRVHDVGQRRFDREGRTLPAEKNVFA